METTTRRPHDHDHPARAPEVHVPGHPDHVPEVHALLDHAALAVAAQLGQAQDQAAHTALPAHQLAAQEDRVDIRAHDPAQAARAAPGMAARIA